MAVPLCDLSYTTARFPAPPDIACVETAEKNFTVVLPDLHRFDGDRDGVDCET